MKNERAIEDFDEALRIKPDFSIACSNRGAAYWRIDNIGNAPRSIEDYNHAIKFDPKYFAPYITLSRESLMLTWVGTMRRSQTTIKL